MDVTLTGQMTNDFATTLFIISSDEVALGFTNQFNADKAGWMEAKYGEIFELTSEEEKMAEHEDRFLSFLVKEAIKISPKLLEDKALQNNAMLHDQ